jgi:two-component system chemotaxis response regulator CheY
MSARLAPHIDTCLRDLKMARTGPPSLAPERLATQALPETTATRPALKAGSPSVDPGAMATRILVVDDSRTIRREVVSTLTEAGYDVCESEDGAHAIEVINTQRDIALVICDVNMPRMTGLEMLATVKADPRNAGLLVVMLTNEGQTTLIQQAKSLGARGWIVKPLKPEVLIATTRRLVGR